MRRPHASTGARGARRAGIGAASALLVGAVLTAPVAFGQDAATSSGTPGNSGGHAEVSLDILLTNDDGFDASTLRTLKTALVRSGHEVTVVAPCTDQSGRGTAEASNYYTGHGNKADHTITASQVSAQTWKVCGTPADSVLFGLQVVFTEQQPDLVVSGINPGQNIGAVANHSGTVGATITALEFGVPAIAVSAAYSFESDPPRLGSITDTAAFTVELIDQLQQGRYGGLLPEHTALNVNYPAVADPRGIDVTKQGAASFVTPRFKPAGDVCTDCYLVVPDTSDEPESVRDADTTALSDGKISITPLSGFWTAGPRVIGQLRADVHALRRTRR